MRDELKYVLPVDALPRVRRAIEPFMRLDEYAEGYEERGYTVRSIYLDSSTLRDYHDKIGHLHDRKKIRIRGYNDPAGTVYLEIKRKRNATVSKERAPVKYGDLASLLQTGRYADYVTSSSSDVQAVGRRVCYHVYRDDLRPTSLVVYEREAFQGLFDETFRVTLDRSIRSLMYPDLDGLYCEDGLIEAVPGYFVMEVKFNTRLPAWMRQVISEFGVMQRAASKYCLCIDSYDRRIDTKTAVLACTSSVASTAHLPIVTPA